VSQVGEDARGEDRLRRRVRRQGRRADRGLDEINWVSVHHPPRAWRLLLLGRRFARMVPWALVVLVVATIVVVVADLDDAGVAVLGEVPAGPPALTGRSSTGRRGSPSCHRRSR
jgi:hypothetical protein